MSLRIRFLTPAHNHVAAFKAYCWLKAHRTWCWRCRELGHPRVGAPTVLSGLLHARCPECAWLVSTDCPRDTVRHCYCGMPAHRQERYRAFTARLKEMVRLARAAGYKV